MCAYRRLGSDYQSSVDAAFQDLLLGGLPVVGKLAQSA